LLVVAARCRGGGRRVDGGCDGAVLGRSWLWL
jgi:hypothetical protein